MNGRKRLPILLVTVLSLALVAGTASAGAPESPTNRPEGPGVAACLPGSGYTSGCDVDQDGDIDITDVQLTAGRWNSSGTYSPGHNHLGETWTGNNNPLTIGGTFNTAPLVTSNSGGDGLRVESAGLYGVRVTSASLAGVKVGTSTQDGVLVETTGAPGGGTTYSLLNDGYEIANAEGRGYFVGRAGFEGVGVYRSDGDGLKVYTAGAPAGTAISSASNNGLEIENAQGNGVFVGHSDGDGVHVQDGGVNGGFFRTAVSNGNGIYAEANTGSLAYGVWGVANAGYAGYFSGKAQVNGNLAVFGTLSKTAGSFKIDHPLDPANKYLYHSFVESPDMKNIYDGVATLDANGAAVVTLPDWFEALNEEFRYQLTCIGGYAPVYIAQEIKDNQFTIAGGTAGLKVSWQVTGIRHDPYAEDNRIPVEELKAEPDRGRYIYPAGYGESAALWVAENLEKPSPDQLVGPGSTPAAASVTTTPPR